MHVERVVQVGETVRYARTSSLEAYLEGYLNFHHLTRSPRQEDKRIVLESGINRIAPVGAAGGARRPAIVDDQYPVVLVNGRRLAEVVRRIAHESYGGSVTTLLDEVAATYEGQITHRRPEEVITSA